MKPRVKGNSLILRITRSELSKLYEAGRLEETIYFSTDHHSKLVYALEHESRTKSITLRYQSPEILFVLPSERLERWILSDQKGVYTTIDLGSQGAIELLIEKDYECLDKTQKSNPDENSLGRPS